MEYEIRNSSDELTHWGIRGMRWGIRRYQNKDGSLTPAGKKRLKAESDALKKEEEILKNRKSVKAKLDRLAARKKAVEDEKKALDEAEKAGKKGKKSAGDEAEPDKKSVKDMSDTELANAIRRRQMEKQYADLTAEPKPVEKGSTFVKDFVDKSVTPAVQEAGRSLIKDSLLKLGKKYLGLEGDKNGDDYVDKLGKEVKKMTLEKQYKKLKEEAEGNDGKSSTKDDKSGSKKDKTDDSDSSDDPKTTKPSASDTSASPAAKNNSNSSPSATSSTPKESAPKADKAKVKAGKDYVEEAKNTTIDTSKYPNDEEWSAFVSKYSWGRESWATDRVDD